MSLHAIALAAALATKAPHDAYDGPVALNVSGLPLPAVLRDLSLECSRNIVGDAGTSQITVTLNVSGLSCLSAIDMLARTYNLTVSTAHGVTLMSTLPVSGMPQVYHLTHADGTDVAKEISALLGQQGSAIADLRTNSVVVVGSSAAQTFAARTIAELDSSSNSSIESENVFLRNSDPTAVAKAVTTALGDQYGTYTIVARPESASVIVTGTPVAVGAIKQMVAAYDTTPHQVRFALRVLDIEPINDQKSVGIIFGGVLPQSSGSAGASQVTPGAAFMPSIGSSIQVNATLNALVSQGSARVLASPNTTVESGHAGKILVGTDEKLVVGNPGLLGGQAFTDVQAGVIFNVEPIVARDGIQLSLTAEYSQIIGLTTQGLPQVGTRHEESVIFVKPGQTLVFGGLTQDVENRTTTKVPLLGDIPLFGRLFRNESMTHVKEEIVFELTPETVGEP